MEYRKKKKCDYKYTYVHVQNNFIFF